MIDNKQNRDLPGSQDVQDLYRLIGVGIALYSEMDLDFLLTLIIDKIIEIISAERGVIILVHEPIISTCSAPGTARKKRCCIRIFSVSRTIVTHVIETGQPLLIGDVGKKSAGKFTES